MKIVFVDDNITFLNSMKAIIQISDFGLEPVCFEDALLALSYIVSNRQDIRIVFTDYQMSKFGMSGNIIADKCTELALPVYICTGYSDLSHEAHCEVVSKIHIEKILEIVREYIPHVS